MQRYNPKEIEPKWQAKWETDKIYQASEDPSKPKRYVLEYFPYPSGAAMHVGHVRNYTIGDAIARFNRMNGLGVLHPMGWDAFGLPAENYAIKHKISPRQAIDDSITRFRQQLIQMGFSYDWSREIDSTDPKYYKWTQWFFLMLFKKGLAYQQESLQWWCPVDKTVLANEQVENGKCWRCGNEVEKKSLKQWFFKITEYADRLLDDLDDLNWSESIKTMQRNWIGRSRGTEIDFPIVEEADYVLLHGYTGSPEGTFFPVLREKIEALGHRVFAPQLPNTDNPTIMEQVKYVHDNYDFTENTVLLGHSLGSPVALKVVEGLNQPIKKLVIVAGFAQPKFLDKKRPFEETFDWQFDYDKIKKNVREIVVLRAENDSAVPPERSQSLVDNLGGTIIDFVAEKDHACGKNEPVVIENTVSGLKVFTTRADTIFSAAFMVLAPEHPLVANITTDEQKTAVADYVKATRAKSDIERQEDKEKSGVFTGSYAINPSNGEKIPVWIGDFVLAGYGTGAIFGDIHDERDFEFIKKFDIPARVTVVPEDKAEADKVKAKEYAYTGEGILIDSGEFSGQRSEIARDKIIVWLAEKGSAKEVVNYKMRDWLISRQRYWGAPIPIIHCSKDGAVAVPDDQLPVVLPEVKSYEPSGDGHSPLANVPEFVKTTCPKCGGPAERETDTMDGFACSSWYFLRFADPHNDKQPFDKSKAKFWLPVDDYIGGAEHAVMHLLYARFWTKVMYDEKLINFQEPFTTLRNHGMILAPDGQKMSKSKNNTIEPDSIIKQGYGADSVRLMELFIGPWDQAVNWSVTGVAGTHRFLQRVWVLAQEFMEASGGKKESIEIKRTVHKTIKKVSEDLRDLSFNTAIAAQMELVNELYRIKATDNYGSGEWQWALESLAQLLAPFAPHIAEELWQQLGHEESVHTSQWPAYDEKYLVQDKITVAIQVNGKLRGEVQVGTDASEEEVVKAAKTNDKVAGYLAGRDIRKTVYVPARLVNFVV
jgi:leucyl-tRNA synthetase